MQTVDMILSKFLEEGTRNGRIKKTSDLSKNQK